MDYSALEATLDRHGLQLLQPFLTAEFLDSLRHGDFQRWRRLAAELPTITPSHVDLGEVIRVGRAADSDAESLTELRSRLRELLPWRKGPFELFGIKIDSEWQSQLKWARLQHHIQPLHGKTVLDVGSGNGYYSFRMHAAGAALTVGIDPHLPYVGQFAAIKHYLAELPVHVLPLGLEQWPAIEDAFDTAFSMGVLYHRRSPIDHLLQLHQCLKPGGELVLETIVVDGPEGYCLTPEQRYARMNNVWFVPSIATTERWLQRSGFSDVRLVNESLTTVEEQRRTDWMPFDSFLESLDADDVTRTIEGYPAPKRALIVARKI